MALCDIARMTCTTPFNNVNLEDFNHLYETHRVCKCLPACDTISYNFEVEASGYEEWHDDWLWYTAEFTFKFRDSEYFPLVRTEQFKFKDLAAYVGGLLGLFIGTSALSIFETFYFFLIRFPVNIVRFVRHRIDM
jgi:Amiloride-sensitive sodium channel